MLRSTTAANAVRAFPVHLLARLLLGWLLLAPSFAQAKADSVDAEVTRLAKESHKQYQAGDYVAAAETLLRAYELKPASLLLFNIAKTYEKANNTEQAMRFYQRYLDASDADPKLVLQASRSLEKLRLVDDERRRKEQEQKAADEAKQHETDRLAADEAAKKDADAKADDVKKQQELAAAQQQPKVVVIKKTDQDQNVEKPSKVPGALVLAAGVVAAGAGAYCGLTAQSRATQEKSSIDPVQKPQLRTQARTFAAIADGAYGLGAIGAVVGIVLLARSGGAPATENKVEVQPASGPQVLLIPGGAGLAWSGSL
jgi:tetratricopeptide (TPR) repeat protein